MKSFLHASSWEICKNYYESMSNSDQRKQYSAVGQNDQNRKCLTYLFRVDGEQITFDCVFFLT